MRLLLVPLAVWQCLGVTELPPLDPARIGTPLCWDDAQGITFESCCNQEKFGPYGNKECWSVPFSFELCCLPDWKSRAQEPSCAWLQWMVKWHSEGQKMESPSGEVITNNPQLYQESCCLSYQTDPDICWSHIPEFVELIPGANVSKGYATCCFDHLQSLTDALAAGKPDPPWLMKELQAETGVFETPLRAQDMDRVLREHEKLDLAGHCLCRIRRTNTGLSVEPSHCMQNGRITSLSIVLKILNWRGLLPDPLDLIVTSRDIELVDYGVPVFTDIRPASLGGGRLLRYPHEFLLSPWGRLMNYRVRRGVMSYPWEHKDEVLFWRGGMTGRWICPPDGGECVMLKDYHRAGQWNLTHWHLGVRGRAALLSSFAPKGLVDMKFTSPVGMQNDVAALLRERGWLDTEGNGQMLQDQFKAKYLLVTDDSDRAYWMATGNSLLFMPSSSMLRGCGLAAFQPWIHYIPLKPDLSDAIERVMWAKENDDEARIIAARGAALAREAFSHEAQLYCLLRMVQQVSVRFVD